MTPDNKFVRDINKSWQHLLASLESLLGTGESIVESHTWPEGM